MADLYQLPKYDQHPVASTLMPGGMTDDEFKAFCEDVKERGILMPIWLYENKVLDGWHRYRAAKLTGSRPDFKEYTGKDPAGFVASCNIHRRKLSSLQRALVGARLHKDHALTQRQVCAKLGISNEVLNLTVKVLESKNTKIIKRIETDADFTRSMLREELTDAGLLRAKPPEEIKPETLTNSVFALGDNIKRLPLTGKEGTITYNYDATPQAADGAPPAEEEDADEDVDDLLDTPSLAAEKRKAKKPRETAVQAAVDTFKALREEEQQRFITAIWPLARGLAKLDAVWAGNLLPLVAAAAPAAAPKKGPAKPASSPPAARKTAQATPLAGKPAKARQQPAKPAARKGK